MPAGVGAVAAAIAVSFRRDWFCSVRDSCHRYLTAGLGAGCQVGRGHVSFP
jgi:hypothetical protein